MPKLVLYLLVPLIGAGQLGSADLAFFESEVTPRLIDNCYKWHAADSKKTIGNFLMDSQPGILQGGESGFDPTPKELKNFLEDTSPEPYTRQFDRLFSSPNFGKSDWINH